MHIYIVLFWNLKIMYRNINYNWVKKNKTKRSNNSKTYSYQWVISKNTFGSNKCMAYSFNHLAITFYVV